MQNLFGSQTFYQFGLYSCLLREDEEATLGLIKMKNRKTSLVLSPRRKSNSRPFAYEVIWSMAVIDLLPGTPYNQQISNCCKGGVLKSGLASSFQISVGAAGTSNSTVRMAVNFMFTAPKQQYICGPTKNVMRTKFITSASKRTTSALMTWNIACVFHKAT
ncbi:unnamed protein product [Brassica rapa]|uniref:Uncharacterized protein n=1 Tax=Brassica campestris TaxID=3711 RepID=A0A8D9FWK1_BRACM|nr:unnamed protein product [Brassica rapa]